MSQEEELTKVHIDLPNHWGIGGESMWAKHIADDLYRLENVPFYAYGLNYGDVVRATPDSPQTNPEIREVVRPSGHATLRCLFDDGLSRDKQADLLGNLEQWGASYERADGRLIAIDISADGAYGSVYDQLQVWEDTEILSFETCEQRADGSFDDIADSDSAN